MTAESSNLPMADRVASIHAWGFFDAKGTPKRPSGMAPSDLSPYHHHRQVERNVRHFGGTITNLHTTSTLDGLLVATEFVTPAREGCKPMWHQIVQPAEPWPDPTRRESPDTTWAGDAAASHRALYDTDSGRLDNRSER